MGLALAALGPSSAVLAMEFDIRMAHTVVSSEGVGAAKRLLVRAQIAPYLLLPRVVNRVLVPGEVIGPREDGIAWLSRARVDTVAPVRTGLAIEKSRCHAYAGTVASPCGAESVCLSMAFSLVLL